MTSGCSAQPAVDNQTSVTHLVVPSTDGRGLCLTYSNIDPLAPQREFTAVIETHSSDFTYKCALSMGFLTRVLDEAKERHVLELFPNICFCYEFVNLVCVLSNTLMYSLYFLSQLLGVSHHCQNSRHLRPLLEQSRRCTLHSDILSCLVHESCSVYSFLMYSIGTVVQL